MFNSARFVALLVLAAGGLLGFGAATGRLHGAARTEAAPQDREEVILFEVLVPADAVLEIGGVRTQTTGMVRHFQTPPLRVGGEYTYVLKVAHQGKEVTRELHVKHGKANTLDLRADFPTAAPPRTLVAGKPRLRAGAPGLAPVAQASEAGRARGNPQDEAAIQKQAEAFVEAFHKGDARTVAACWVPDGDLTGPTGEMLKGREAIEKAFAALFDQTKGLKVRIESTSLRFVTPEVAIEEGTTAVFPPDGAPPSRARYSNVHVKKDGKWLLSSVRETPFVPPSNYQQLRGLEWVIGDWAGEGPDGAVERLSVAWSDNQNFLTATFAATLKNVSIGSATQWIGWDPVAKRIRSWIFDVTGGFGEGAWSQDGNQWVVKTTSTLQDGKKATATYVLTPVDADTMTLQARDRSKDGDKLPDTREVKLKRVK